MPRKDIEFQTVDRVTLRGWLFTPSSYSGKLPCLVMAHGWSCIKEMELDRVAEYFTKTLPMACLIYDHRSFGASDAKEGEPRREIIPSLQASDHTDAVTYACSLSEIDPERIGIWGYSYAGGNVIVAGGGDFRVKVVIAQNPFVSGLQTLQRMVRTDFIGPAFQAFAADRQARMAGQEPGRIPVVDANPMAQACLPTVASYQWFSSWEKKSDWKNDVTLRSTYSGTFTEPMGQIQYISPRPFLMVVSEKDNEAPVELALEAYAKAREPKELQVLPGGHFDVFGEGNFEKTMAVQADFLKRKLCA